jgi:SAM-dependent methyltransferase
MTNPPETYTPGYSEPTLRLMLGRTAAKHAAFFTPFLQSGMRLLDCGCGPGTITVDLAKLVSPGQVFGIDLEPGQVRFARDRARQMQTNASFEVASIYALPFQDGHFDAVFAHALFEHLREPVRALREIRRVLRPSGLVGIRGPDWAGWVVHPLTPLLEDAFRLFKEIQIANGGNPYVGRTLKGLLREAGFSNISVSASYEIFDDLACFTEWLANCLELRGHTELRKNARDLCAWCENPDTLVAVSWLEGLGVA